MKYAGIDYSTTSPSICIYDDQQPANFANCQIYFLTSLRKAMGKFDNMIGTEMIRTDNNQAKYHFISEWAVEKLVDVQYIMLEGYAYNATGRVFNIAENTGVLKHKLFSRNQAIYTTTPLEMKKYATKKGNASKQLLDQAFVEQTGVDLKQVLNLTEKQWNPSSDIIDSYFLCMYGVHNGSRLSNK